MFITILDRGGIPPKKSKSQLFLTIDNWNDYSFLTLYELTYIDDESKWHGLGSIKIGYFGQVKNERKLNASDTFDQLDKQFFSVGLDDNYYQSLNELGEEVRDKILISLNDIARNAELCEKAMEEEVAKVSFLRGLSATTITGQFRRLSTGGSRLTKYDFHFSSPTTGQGSSMNFSFAVEPDSSPPTNIHILIGRNGVGKTHLIHNMIGSLTKYNEELTYGKFSSHISADLFANLICITFSAFDEFDHPPERMDKSLGIQYSYIGLKNIQESGDLTSPKNPTLLKDEFVKSITACKNSSKIDRWKKAIHMLESDPIFKEEDITSLIEKGTDLKTFSSKLFNKLSSGHKIVLLTITRLVETLQERSLVLIDEPEAHLHPPLLSSFTRALSDLLIDRNAVSIIATHSPVVLQEVPKNCVWKLRRSGSEALVERLEIESFGENVGILTQEVFGLEVTESGFHTVLKNIVKNTNTFEEAAAALNGNIGLEAKAILRSLFYQKDKSNEGHI